MHCNPLHLQYKIPFLYFQYKSCTPNNKTRSTTIGPGALIKCKSDTNKEGEPTIDPRAKIFGIIYFDTNASAGSYLHVEPGAIVTLGENVSMGHTCHLKGRIKIAARARIGMYSNISKATIGVGAFVSIGVTITDAQIMNGGMLMMDSTVQAKAVVGVGAALGEKATLMAGISIGDGSCVEDGVTVTKNLPARSIMFKDKTTKKIAADKKAYYSNGTCQEVDKNKAIYT